jgi:2-polyprenyl-3-methyl-5-hydroxy-6-metoxy-1,4-benzoquinol methylase
VTAPSSETPGNLRVFDTAPEAARDFDISDPELLRMLESSQGEHFWFPARNRQIVAFLRSEGLRPPARVLEVGCGSGTVLSALAAAGFDATGLEMHRELARRAAVAVPRAAVFSANVFAPPAELVARGPFDAVGFFDVLEHLEAAETVLRATASLLAPGGRLVGTLPALDILWSDYDAFAGHRLRYDRRRVAALFGRAGLPAPRAAYFFQALVPGLLIRRALVGRGRAGAEGNTDARRRAQHRALDAPGGVANALFAAACSVERGIRRVVPIDRVPGASLWFSVRVDDPARFREERPPTGRTGGGS